MPVNSFFSSASATLDDLRYLYAVKTDKPCNVFPSTENAFKHHVERAKYQTAVWVNSHQAQPQLWNPFGNGWMNHEGLLVPEYFEDDAAPVEVSHLSFILYRSNLQ